MINEALSANMQKMFDELRVDDNTNIMDGNKELALDEVGPGFYSLGYDRDGSCFEMNKISKESAKDSITGYGEYKVADADITDFNGARYYYNENMPDSGVLNIKKTTNENLRHGDLEGVVTNRISVDEFEPKTGEKEDIAVIGFYVTEQAAGEDLARFIAKSVYESRDVEVTPNPNEDNLYMVFVEVDRKDGLVEGLRDLVKDITNVSKDLDWKVKPLLSDNELDLADPMLETIIRQSPESYQTKEAYQEQLEKDRLTEIEDFIINNSNVQDAVLENNTLTLKDYKYNVQLEFVQFGEGKVTLEEAGISEAAIDYDWDKSLVRMIESMRGTLNIIPISKHIVFHNPQTDQVLIAKPC